MNAPDAKALVTAWSYSRFRDYDKCPRFFKFKHLDKFPEPDSPAMARGSEIGKLAEDFTIGKIKSIPLELSLFRKQFTYVRTLKNRNVWCEQTWMFDRGWNPIHHEFPCKGAELNFPAFTQKDWLVWRSIWLRVKMDLVLLVEDVLYPVDHKTGRYKSYDIGSYLDQLEIYSVSGLIQQPDARVAYPRLWFLDMGLEYPQGDADAEHIEYTRADIPRITKKWDERVRPLFADREFKPTPGRACKYCPYQKERGGQCEF